MSKLLKRRIGLMALVFAMLIAPASGSLAATYDGMDPYIALVQKQLGIKLLLRYYSHVQKGPAILLETFEDGTSGPGGTDMRALFVVNSQTRKVYELRQDIHSQPVVAYGDEYFDQLRILSLTQVSFTHVIGKDCYDYQAKWHPGHKVYQPKLLKKRVCA